MLILSDLTQIKQRRKGKTVLSVNSYFSFQLTAYSLLIFSLQLQAQEPDFICSAIPAPQIPPPASDDSLHSHPSASSFPTCAEQYPGRQR